jgi:8-oxo-dGTP pyrophosphatase MutT (NUDIX family)
MPQHIMSTTESWTSDGIAKLLATRPAKKIRRDHFRKAAVLMPILLKEGEPHFLLTERTHQVETHKGQISFPGGVMEPTDPSLLQTALRETEEEIGLPRERVKTLGEFDDYLSITNLVVTPFAGWIDGPGTLTPNPVEVSEILLVPLTSFRDEKLTRMETRKRAEGEEILYFYDFQGKVIWGLTARIIRDFLRAIQSGATAPATDPGRLSGSSPPREQR